MANNWKRVKVDFKTVKLGNFIEPIKSTFSDLNDAKYSTVYGVSNTDGICITGKEASKDISKYIVLEKDCFAFNPYRINVGSIGINGKGLKGCVSPAYVVFKTNEKLNPYFLYHYLKSDYGNHLINWYGNRGGVRNALRFDDLCQIDIPDIDLSTQLSLLKEIQNYRATFDSLSYESINQTTCLTKLRQAILQEAIEGKLTADRRKENPVRKGDPDYDAEALLEKIQAEKEKLIKAGKIKKQKPLAPIKAEEVPFDLPEGWVWTRLEYISSVGTGATPLTTEETYYKNGTINWITSSSTGSLFIEHPDKLITEKAIQETNCQIYPINTLVIAMYGQGKTRGQISELKIPAATNQALAAIQLYLIADSHRTYIKHFFMNHYLEIRKLASGGAQPNLNMEKVKTTFIPLPPLAEQQAIVDRVEKLLAMVDELEKQVSERKEQSEQLMQAVLREAFEGES